MSAIPDTRRELPEFAEIPPGTLPEGADSPGFGLAVVPTTVFQYWLYLVDSGLRDAPDPRLHGFPAEPGTGLRAVGGGVVLDEDLGALPATGVTWHGALAYCAWLSPQVGRPCGLPTAAEWRYAAGGSLGSRWALGDVFDRQVYAPPSATGPRPVGATPPNAYGVRDLTGNVFEWCADRDATAVGSRVIKGGAYTVRNPESFENTTAFTADELSAVPYIGFRVLAGDAGRRGR
ncbi:SUMF1/EgtB/PvdO family nonheme iron enzyme [Actinokineospora auranticolor]|uniref:Sulfatase-modifying factor enzyme 1 n=1 Tax=Actinokineospora auranticolor TaxID=155976 RepID=A0A2S6H125_9PSEU|nr:SUMF1/EgtB/PvdO family nonheme iron enzyme [Actinokineospora auranticolor]PPK71189.1 sulfatase-modifying factor enzyme 1 [Actinokineospora auranticolor]